MKFRESAIAHKYLDGLKGIEIGGSAHNDFGLDTINVDYTDDMETVFKVNEEQLCGEKMKVDVVANGDDLPFEDESTDFVISSHVIEHFFDPIKAINEWLRVVKKGGYILIIAPHKDRIFDSNRSCTTNEELLKRHSGEIKMEDVDRTGWHHTSTVSGLDFELHGHWCAWTTEAFKSFLEMLKVNIVEIQDTDDKVGNGFLFIIKK